MASLFDFVDRIQPKTKIYIIGAIFFGYSLAIQTDQRPAPQPAQYTPNVSPAPVNPAPIMNQTDQSNNDKAFQSVLSSVATTSPIQSSGNLPAEGQNLTTPQAVQVSGVIDPSFKCSDSKSVLEQIICSDAELAALDKQVAQKYFEALAKANKDQKDDEKDDQRDFLKFRVTACNVPKAWVLEADFPRYATCLKTAYNQRLEALQQLLNPPAEAELPWLKEKRLKAEATASGNSAATRNLTVTPMYNQNDFNACMDGDKSRCHFEVMTSQQQAIITAADKRNFNACLNGWSLNCNKRLLTPEQKELVQKSDIERNFTACNNGWAISCNKSWLTPEQLEEVNKNDLARNLTACLNGWSINCNKQLLTDDEKEQVTQNEIQRNYNACLNGWTLNCDKSLLTPEQLGKLPPQ